MEGEDELGIDLVRGADGDWVVAATTVEGVPAMAKSMGVWWITSLPEFLVCIVGAAPLCALGRSW